MSDSTYPDAQPSGVITRIRQASFRVQLAIIVAIGGVWRAIMLASNWNRRIPLTDSFYYSIQARDLLDGHWFREPFRDGPAAEHGPLTTVVLASVSWMGDPVPWQRMMTTLFGIATIAVIGLLGRLVGGERVGLVAAGLAAVYPNLWLSDSLVMSESISVCVLSIALLLMLRQLDRPIESPDRFWRKDWWVVGAVFGVTALARSETVVLIPMAAVLAVWLPAAPDDRRRGMASGGALLAGGLLVLAPWVAFNMARFEQPVFLTTNDGTTLAGAYCDDSFHGSGTGGWTILCLGGDLSDEVLTEPSVRSQVRRDAAVDYLSDNLGDLPRVVAARVGRTLDVYGIDDMLELDTGEERPLWGAWAGIVMFWVLAPLAVIGLARQRRNVRWTLVLPVISVALSTIVFYGAHRIRSTAEPTIVIGAAAAIGAFADRRRAPTPARLEPATVE